MKAYEKYADDFKQWKSNKPEIKSISFHKEGFHFYCKFDYNGLDLATTCCAHTEMISIHIHSEALPILHKFLNELCEEVEEN